MAPGPGLVGTHGAPPPAAGAETPAAGAWADPARPVVWGPWRTGEVRVVVCPGAWLVVVGDCRADDHRVRADLRAAVHDNRWEPITRWPGSYLAIVLAGGRLTAFADLAGQHPLFFHPGPPFVFGTSAQATARRAGLGTRPDPVHVLADVFCAAAPVLTRGRTPLTGVRRLEAGESLRVSASGSWHVEPPSTPTGPSTPDWPGRLRAALSEAVAGRRAPLSADFSGGLDSTSVAFLAARDRAEPLPVFTYHHPDAPADDLAHALRNATPDLHLEVVHGTAATLPYQDLAAAPTTDLPDFAATTHARNRLRLARAAAAGSRVHLGGEGADALLVAPPAYLGDLARAGRVGALLDDTRAWARLRDDSPTRVLNRALRLGRTPMTRALRTLSHQLRHGHARQPEWVDAIAWWPAPGLEARWLTASARRTLADFVGDHAATAPDVAPTGVADLTAYHDLRRSGAVQRQLSELARPYGVWPQAPFLDNDVIRVCTERPAHQRAEGTAFKPLLRAALRDLVPEHALARRTKGNYLGEEYRGVRAAAPALRAALRASPLADLGLVEPAEVVASVDRAAAGAGAPFPALNRLLAYDLWLARL